MSNKKIILVGGIPTNNVIAGGEAGKNANLLDALQDCGRSVITANIRQLSKYPWRSLSAILTLLIHPTTNVVISSSLKRSGWLLKLLHYFDKKRNICFIGTGCEFSGRIARGEFDAKYFRNVKNIIVQGESMKKELQTVGLNAIVLPNFKKMTYLAKLPERCAEGVVKFVFMSRMNEKKGVNMILDCVRRLNQSGFNDKYLVDFYGPFEDKAYQDSIMSIIDNVPNTSYKGILNLRDNIGYDTLASYTVMLFPTFWPGEGFPGVLVDALIAGLPVIASDWHFNPDIVENGKTGIIIPTQNEEALFVAMKDAIENSKKYLEMAEYCQEKAREYDTQKVINEEFLARIQM